MKKIIVVFVASCLCFSVMAQEIAFEHADFATVCAKAKAENKMVFIDFYTSWCGPCKHMAETVFKQDNVGQYMNSHYISYKMDAEKGEGRTLAGRYQVHIYPTYLFLDDKGAVFNETYGACADTVFLGIAAKGLAEYINPLSLPRLKSQYAAHKKDTAFLRQYIEKLVENKMQAFEPIEQYLSVQTAMSPGSPEMMSFILKYPKQLYYGGRAAQLFEKYSDSFRKIADSGQRWQMELIENVLPGNTRTYAIESKSETVLKSYIAAEKKAHPSGAPAYVQEAAWLDFYSATGNWSKYRPLANKCLDSICSSLKPIAAGNDDNFFKRKQPPSPEETRMRRGAALVSEHAKVYFDHFSDEKDVLQKALHWMKAAVDVNANQPGALTFYANLLYLNKDTAGAISTKMKALNSMPAISLHRNIVQTNLAHMQHGEALEEE